MKCPVIISNSTVKYNCSKFRMTPRAVMPIKRQPRHTRNKQKSEQLKHTTNTHSFTAQHLLLCCLLLQTSFPASNPEESAGAALTTWSIAGGAVAADDSGAEHDMDALHS